MSNIDQSKTLLIIEELLVLLIDREHGGIVEINDKNLRHAIAGAVLMDLANLNRIDTHLDQMIVADASMTDDIILDYFLTVLQEQSNKSSVSGWIEHFSSVEICNYIRRRTIDRLIRKKILYRDPGGVLWIDQQVDLTGRYPGVPLPEGLDVHLRALNIIVTEEVPSPEVTMLIALIDACGISERVFSKSITAARRDRIQLIGRIDNIGRSIRKSISDANKPIAESDIFSRINSTLTSTKYARPPMMPKALPVVGHSYMLRPIPAVTLARYYTTLGPIFRIRAFRDEYTVLCGPEANVFCQNKSRSLFRSHYMYSSFAEGMDVQRLLLSMDGEEHQKVRRGLSQGFSSERYMEQLSKIRDIILGEISLNGVATASHMCTQNVAKSLAWVCNEYIPTTQQVDDLDYFFRYLIVNSPLKHLPDFINAIRPVARFKRAKNELFSIFRSMSKEYQKNDTSYAETDLLSALLEFHQKSPQTLPESELKVLSLAPIFAGMHNTASTLTSTLYLLLKHPDIFMRVQEESDYLYQEDQMEQPALERFGKMNVTRRVIMESLRMYNPFSTVFRKVINTFDFGGYTIPQGTILLIPFGVPHYCKEFFPEPQKFDIDRYLPNRMEHRPPGVYLPYGFGTHQCLGSSISDIHLLFSVATILHHYDIEMVPSNYKMKMIFDGVPFASKKFKIKFRPRQKFHSTIEASLVGNHDESGGASRCPVIH